MFKHITKQIARVTHELCFSGFLLSVYFTGAYAYLAPTLQTIMLKATLVSLGFLHAHITNKVVFPAINWSDADADKSDKIRAIVLYFVFIYCYCLGG